VAMMGPEGRFVDVGGEHPDLVVAATQVELGEEYGAAELVQEFVDDRDGEHVADGDGIEGAVVDAESPCPVLLAHQQDRGGERGRAGAYDALPHHVRALALDLVLQQLGVSVRSNRHWSRPGQQVNVVVEAAARWESCRRLEEVGE